MIGGLQDEYSSDEEIITDPPPPLPTASAPPAPPPPTFGTIPAWGTPTTPQTPTRTPQRSLNFDGEPHEGSPTKKWPDARLPKHAPPPPQHSAKSPAGGRDAGGVVSGGRQERQGGEEGGGEGASVAQRREMVSEIMGGIGGGVDAQEALAVAR